MSNDGEEQNYEKMKEEFEQTEAHKNAKEFSKKLNALVNEYKNEMPASLQAGIMYNTTVLFTMEIGRQVRKDQGMIGIPQEILNNIDFSKVKNKAG